MANLHGWFYHFLDVRSGARYRTSEVSTSDSTWLVAGALTARQYFEEDQQIARLASTIYQRVDYRWTLDHIRFFSLMAGMPERGFLSRRVNCLLLRPRPSMKFRVNCTASDFAF